MIVVPGSRAQVQWLWHPGLVGPQLVGSSQPGIEPVSSVWTDRFFTTEPPGKHSPHQLPG